LFVCVQETRGISKFKDKGLQNEELLAEMFEDLRNTGEDHWGPSSGQLPQSPVHESLREGDGTNDIDDDSEPEEIAPSSGKGKRPQVSLKDKGKKPKTSGGQWMQDQMSYIVQMNEKTVASFESVARRDDTSGCSIKDVMDLVKACGAMPGSNEFFIGSQIFLKKAEREMFMTLDTPEEQFQWLTMKHAWVTRNDLGSHLGK